MVFAIVVADSGNSSCMAENGLHDGQTSDLEFNGVWRDIDHGAINSLYCFLRIYGWPGDYAQCLAATKVDGLPENSHELLQVANRLGQELDARLVTPAHLNKLRLPVIIHIDGDRPEEGSFGVLLQVDDRRVVLMNGPSATIVNMNRETFLRRWSGAVFMPGESQNIEMLAAASGTCVGLLISYFLFRR